MRNFRNYLLVSLFAVLGACGGDSDNGAVECEETCSANATCDTSGDVGVCECNTGFTGDGLSCQADDGCEGVSDCTVEGTTCTGDDVVACEANADGCLVESTVDCTATDEVCYDDGSAAVCTAECTDDPACDGVTAGDAICDGNTPSICDVGAGGCVEVTTGTSCGLEVCDDGAGSATCVANASGDSCAEPFLVLDDVALTGADITADFTDVEAFSGAGCSATTSTAGVDAVFSVPLLAGQTVVLGEFGGVDIVLGIMPDCTGDTACYAGVDASSGPTEEAGISYTAKADETVTLYASAFFAAPTTTDYDIRIDIATCGNADNELGEGCDDGNAVDGDGCTACQVDFGYSCDDSPTTVCTGPTDLGTFAAAEVIPDTVDAGPIDADVVVGYTITFSESVFLSGTLAAAGGEDIDFIIADDQGEFVFGAGTLGGEEWDDVLLEAGTYTLGVHAFEAAPTGFTLVMSTTAGPVCGDAVVEEGEACDDNMVDNDGCTACVVDPGFVCDNSSDPSVCVLSCGDGEVNGDDECDDGNAIDDDRCSNTCLLTADVLDLDGNDDFANAQVLGAGEVARGSIDPALDAFDLYTFTLVESSWVTVEQYNTVDGDTGNYDGPGSDDTVDCNSDLDVRIFADDADPTDNTTAFIFDDVDGDGICGFVGPQTDGADMLLAAGTYYIKVSEFGDDAAVPLYGLDLQIDAVLAENDACDVDFDLCDPNGFVCNAVTDTCTLPPVDRGNFELFGPAEFDLSNTSLTFTPAGDNFSVVAGAAAAFPDTAGAGDTTTALSLGDDDNQDVTTGLAFPFFGVNESVFFVNSNGSVSFGAGSDDATEAVDDHFAAPRVAFFWDDLAPNIGGAITLDEFADRVTVTFAAVPAFNSANVVNVQAQFFDTGVITFTYLTVEETDALVGLSAGDDFGSPPAETDFSALLP